MKQVVLILIFFFVFFSYSFGQNTYLITSKSVGKVKLGMTVSQVRKAMKGYKFKRTSDGEGVALIDVLKNGKSVMALYAGEEDREKPVNEKAKIEFIEVWDSQYHTAQGLRPNMRISSAEKILGKVKRVFMSEIESREFVEFTKKLRGMEFRIGAGDDSGQAGIYPNGKRESTKFSPKAVLSIIYIS